MPRTARLDLAGIAQHLVQRGNDRQSCFFREADYLRYRATLHESAQKHAVAIHAYVLMTNHVHLLVTPLEAGAVSRMMQDLGRSYVRYLNDRLGRSGTLWEGRFKSSLIDTEHYLLACQRYVELNPVRAGMVDAPGEYPWSSYRANGFGHADALLAPHAAYLDLADEPLDRAARYRQFVAEGTPDVELRAIRLHAARQRALGSMRFQQAIEARLGRRARVGAPGRPRSVPEKVL